MESIPIHLLCIPVQIIAADLALLFPYIGQKLFIDLIYRMIDCDDPVYILGKMKGYIKKIANAPGGKYVIYVLKKRCSPLLQEEDISNIVLNEELYIDELEIFYDIKRYSLVFMHKEGYFGNEKKFDEYIKNTSKYSWIKKYVEDSEIRD